jgi:hypothetical protein
LSFFKDQKEQDIHIFSLFLCHVINPPKEKYYNSRIGKSDEKSGFFYVWLGHNNNYSEPFVIFVFPEADTAPAQKK